MHVFFVVALLVGSSFFIFGSDLSKLSLEEKRLNISNVDCEFREKNSVIFVKLDLTQQAVASFTQKADQSRCKDLHEKLGATVDVYRKLGFVIAVQTSDGEQLVDVNSRITSFNLTFFTIVIIPVLIIWKLLISFLNRKRFKN